MESIGLFREGLLVAVTLSAPALLVMTFFGIVISLIQGLFQVHDQALAHTVKVIALAVLLLLTARWMLNELVSLMNNMFVLLGRVR